MEYRILIPFSKTVHVLYCLIEEQRPHLRAHVGEVNSFQIPSLIPKYIIRALTVLEFKDFSQGSGSGVPPGN